MLFMDRTEAGVLLAEQLKKYEDKNVAVYALPRGGVVTAYEVAKYLKAPLDLVITRKISHPYSSEYAIAAVDEAGHVVGNRAELLSVDEDWLEEEIEKQRKEAVRRREKYNHRREKISPNGKVAVLVDDGVATGLTIRAGIRELRAFDPKELVVAAPVVPRSTLQVLRKEADDVVSLVTPANDTFLGAVGAYYEDFSQVEDSEVIEILKNHEKWLKRGENHFFHPVKSGRSGHE